MMSFLYKMEHKFSKYAIRNLSMILIACYIAGYIIEFAAPGFQIYLYLDPYQIIRGQVWRLLSWLLIPPSESNLVFVLISLLFYYSIGRTLENTWGSFLYNVYIFSGIICTIIGSFLMMGYCYLFMPDIISKAYLESTGQLGAEAFFCSVSSFFSTYYINMSIFLAYAATFPDNQVLLMFLIPVKVKYLGFIYGGFILYELLMGILGGGWYGFLFAFAIGSSLLNFLIFFLTTRRYIRMNRTQKKMHRAFNRNMRNFEHGQNSGAITKHRCAICGRTERDGDELTFRFCSKCEGNYEYCQDHLYTHIHFTK